MYNNQYGRSGGYYGPPVPNLQPYVSPQGFYFSGQVPMPRQQQMMYVPVSYPPQRNRRSYYENSVQGPPPLVSYPQQQNKRSYDTRDQEEEPTKKKQKSVAYSVHKPVNKPPRSISDNTNGKITEGIWRYYENNRQTDEIYKSKVDLRDALYEIVKDIFPYCGLYIVGSSMSGFATKTSDMDLCLMVSPQEIDSKREAPEILMAIQRALRKCKTIRRSQLIRARVPILKFEDYQSYVECDLNINNSVGIRNTHLLRYYAAMDWRVRPLVLFMKKWARFHDINDASKKTISSYSLCLMVIHYLQYGCKPPVLKSVQKLYPDLFDYGDDIKNLRMNVKIEFKSENSQSLGDLLLGLLEYYTKHFNFMYDVASVRLGTKIPIHMIKSQGSPSDHNQWTCLKLEEPFDHSNTARSCFDAKIFSRVMHVFAKSYNTLAQKRHLDSILSHPF